MTFIDWRRTIKLSHKHLFVGIFGFIFATILSLIVLLAVEFHYFKNEAEKIVALQSDYKNYVIAVRRLLRGTTLVNEQASAETHSDEKKNFDESGSSLIVNRGAEYVKESSIAFFRRNRMIDILKRIPLTEWQEYTEQALADQEKAKAATKVTRAKKVKRNKSSIRKRIAMRARRPISPMRMAGTIARLFSWPVDPAHFWLSSLYGPRKNPSGWKFHQGLDMAAIRGTPVKAASAGEVIEARFDTHGYGKMVMISHANDYKTRYAHLDKILVKPGQYVERGTVIGKVGSTGNARSKHYDASHLHFEVHIAGRTVNPLPLIG